MLYVVNMYHLKDNLWLQEVRSTTALLLTAVCRGDSGMRLADRLAAMLPAAAAAGAHLPAFVVQRSGPCRACLHHGDWSYRGTIRSRIDLVRYTMQQDQPRFVVRRIVVT